jgi:hypothetical protein
MILVLGLNEVVRQISQLHKYHLDLRHASVDEQFDTGDKTAVI